MQGIHKQTYEGGEKMIDWYKENEKVTKFVNQTLELAVEQKLTLSEVKHAAKEIENRMFKCEKQLKEKTLDTIINELL